MPRTDLTGWQLIFNDDFVTNAAIGSFGVAYPRWDLSYNAFTDTSGNGLYDPSTVISAKNSVMDFFIHTSGGVHRVCAPGPILPGKSTAFNSGDGQLYGRYSVRFRSESIPAYKVAWLLWPDSDVWADGEIDFPEGDLDSTINAYSHHTGDPTQQDAFESLGTFTPWHTSTVEWTAGQVKFYFDNILVGTSTTNVSSSPMHWVLQTETNLSGTSINDATSGHIQIDWVAVWAAV